VIDQMRGRQVNYREARNIRVTEPREVSPLASPPSVFPPVLSLVPSYRLPDRDMPCLRSEARFRSL
jgi:hypothetical protein